DSLIWWNASISYGVSNPTIFEQIDPAVMIGPGQASWSSILPERGVNYETGFKGTEKHTGIEFEATAYVFLLRDIILPFADSIVSSPNPTIEFTRYRNEGSTRQQGLEAVMRKSWRLRGCAARLDLPATFTRADYRFDSYPSGGDDFRDRLLPGLALHQASGLMQLFSRGESARLSVQYFW
ncbi:MAG: TonB-dependent receptor domain-containing protein, partial [Bacteroidota bacterium]